MFCGPPRFTLFPYTTLFRSAVDDLGVDPVPVQVGQPELGRGRPRPRAGARVPLEADVVHQADRKSTRLNSSHANISYAVFCLKKKTAERAANPRQVTRATRQ